MDSYAKLTIASLLPVVAAILIWLLEEKTPFKKAPYIARQIIIGIVFGAIAIVGTEWGIPMNGAQVNCRDAAPLIAGMLFGGPAGIIAGVIGGVERWIAVAWGIGTFTRVACSVSTVLAGVYAALIRKSLFENKRPKWYIAFAAGVVMEVFHLTMVFVTNLSQAERATAVVKACSAPMIIANGCAVLLAALVIGLLSRENIGLGSENVRISDSVQRRLFVVVLIAYVLTTGFAVILQMGLANSSTDSLLELAISDVTQDINDASDKALLDKTHMIANAADTADLDVLAERFEVEEINLVNVRGIIFDTTNPDYLEYNMYHGNQSAEFCKLLIGLDEYVQEYGPISIDKSVWMKYAGVATDYGFIEVGFTGEQFKQEIAKQIRYAVQNRHVGSTGFILILDKERNVIAAPDFIDMETISQSLATRSVDATPAEGETFTHDFAGTECYLRYGLTDDYIIIAAYPKEEALRARDASLYVNTFMEVLVFAALFGLIYLIIKKIIVERMHRVNNYLEEITGGNLDVKVDVRTNQEFTELSDGINATVDTLKRYIDEAAARIDAELEMAKNIQASALPSRFPAFPSRKDIDIYATMDPAKEVGGDFYDFYFTHRNLFHFVIADVSGKGIPAAMFMMRAKTELKSLTEAGQPIGECFTNSNTALCEGNDAGMFVTAWQGTIDLTTGKVKFANAGHNPPLVYRKETKRFEYLKAKVNLVLAGMEGIPYREQELDLNPGDIILLYTDGVTEATDKDNVLYGEERLLNVVNSREWTSMEELLKEVKADVDRFQGEAPQFDDITMVGFRFIGQPEKTSIHFDEAKLEDIPVVTEFVEKELEKMGCPMKTVIQMNIAIDELYSNIVKYAYAKKNNTGPATVTVGMLEEAEGVEVTFIDEGIPYNPVKYEDPDTTLSADEREIGGLGIFMVKKSMDDMRYEYHDGKNILIIRKKF